MTYDEILAGLEERGVRVRGDRPEVKRVIVNGEMTGIIQFRWASADQGVVAEIADKILVAKDASKWIESINEIEEADRDAAIAACTVEANLVSETLLEDIIQAL